MDKTVALTILKFSAKFLQEMDQTKSVVASPLSAEFILALAVLGATGPTHKELLEELGLPDDNAVRTTFGFLSTSLKTWTTLNIANKIYYNKGLQLLPAMEKDAELFDTEFGEVDFEDSENTTRKINDWVEKKTNGKIKDIYSNDESEKKTELVLLNAIYFKGTWLQKFYYRKTHNDLFQVDSTKSITVPMMHCEEIFSHGWSEALNAQMLMLPYKDSNSKMAIILPRESNGLEQVFKKLAEGHDLLSDINNMSDTVIRVVLPKFKIETTIDLEDVLKKLGVKGMFEGGLTKIVGSSKEAKVSKAIQKTFIVVNEEGTEALTRKIIKRYSRCYETYSPPPFIAKHPFAYVVFGPGDIPVFVGAYRGDETSPLSSIEEMDQTKSVAASPLLAEFALALATLGDSGDTNREMLAALGFPHNHAVRSSFTFLAASLKSLKKTLKSANKIYLQNGERLLPKMETYAEFFDTEFGEVDFMDSKKTKSDINDWVEKKTNSKIKELYSSDGNELDTRLVLLNAIHFKGCWRYRFKPKDTRSEPFRVNSTKVITVPMMYYHEDERFRHGWSRGLRSEILILPYTRSKAKMVIILPGQFDGFQYVFEKLAEGHDLLSDFRKLREKKIHIDIPKFKIETTIDLTEVLKKIGMTAMFKDGFKEISRYHWPLRVSKAIQKAYIDVNEEGCEAAAANIPKIKLSKLRRRPFFTAVHPFAYIVFGSDDIPIIVGAYRGDETAPLSTMEEFNDRWCEMQNLLKSLKSMG